MKLIVNHRTDLFPKLVPALYANSKTHWNQTVHGLTYNVLKLMMEADPVLFDQCSPDTSAAPQIVTSDTPETPRAKAERQWAVLHEKFRERTS